MWLEVTEFISDSLELLTIEVCVKDDECLFMRFFFFLLYYLNIL